MGYGWAGKESNFSNSQQFLYSQIRKIDTSDGRYSADSRCIHSHIQTDKHGREESGADFIDFRSRAANYHHFPPARDVPGASVYVSICLPATDCQPLLFVHFLHLLLFCFLHISLFISLFLFVLLLGRLSAFLSQWTHTGRWDLVFGSGNTQKNWGLGFG